MASIAQLVSEIAHSVQQADSVPIRRAIKLSIIHSRNELIRKSYEAHKITDKMLQQRFKLTLINVPDGDLSEIPVRVQNIKRTQNKVPRPIRLTNNVPFHSIRTIGIKHPIEIAYTKEASTHFYNHLPGMCNVITYDYINEYIYINIGNNIEFKQLGAIVIESMFEYPHLIETETVEGKFDISAISDNDEFLIPEDMINAIKKLVLETLNVQVIRQTNEIPTTNLVK